MQKKCKIFIWQGDWTGGAERVTLAIAEFLYETYGVLPTLGVFRGSRRADIPFPQVETVRLFPRKLVAYNNIAASILLRHQLREYDAVITHAAGFWDRSSARWIWREPGDLDLLWSQLPLRSKVSYWVPYLIALRGVLRCGMAVAASAKAVAFFRRHGRTAIASSNFLDMRALPVRSRRTHRPGEPFNLVFIGRDDPIKNIEFLTHAATWFSKHGITVHLFGVSGDSDATFQYHGWVSEAETLEFLTNEGHALILPSFFEASPLVLLESLVLGVPALVHSPALPTELREYALSYTSRSEFEDALLSLVQGYECVVDECMKRAVELERTYDRSAVLMKEFDRINEYL